ncbi:helicase associated domain-containing protein [Streptomyces sp. NPDC059447]|uniref:helicase associated domain-containing protein n=1 Tax=Streptomyces sp. NPDC059447 TaxID=3346834 RepID=UPI0036C4B63C
MSSTRVGAADQARRAARPGARSRPCGKSRAKGPSKAQAFQRGPEALTQWAEREGAHRLVPRAHGEEITVEDEAEPVVVKLGVWVSNTKSWRDQLTADHLASLAKLGVDWA